MGNTLIYSFFLVGILLTLFFAVVFREPPRFD